MRRRTLRPFAAAIEDYAGALAPATLLADVQRVFAQIAGAEIAREAEPVSEREGVVTLVCSSAVWMQEIDLMGPALVAAVNRELGADRVHAVRCVATRGRAPLRDA